MSFSGWFSSSCCSSSSVCQSVVDPSHLGISLYDLSANEDSVVVVVVVSDPRRGCYMGLSTFIFHFFFFFFRHDSVRAISLEPLLAETPNGVCCLVLRSNCALLLTIQFASLFIYLFFFFFAKILSGPYLWNRYSQRLQIECAAWSCGLILHCCLPPNLLRYFFFFFPPRFCPGHISGTVTRRDSKLTVLLGPAV